MKQLFCSRNLYPLFLFLLVIMPSLLWASAERFQSSRYYFDTEKVPSWVDLTVLSARKESVAGQSVHYYLSEWQTYVGSNDSETTEFTRIVYSPVTESGVQGASEISIDFRPAYESLIIHHVRLEREGKMYDRFQPEDVRLIQQERDIEKHMYNGEVTALMILNDIRPGDVIDYAYSIKGRNPVFAGKFFSSYSLGWNAEVDHVVVRIVAAEKKRLYSRSYNVDIQLQQSTLGNANIYYWQLENSPAVKSEGDTPDWYFPFPWLQITEYKNWLEVSGWADDLYRQEPIISQELKQKIISWKKESQNDEEFVALAIAFVQDKVRYFGVEMGQNSHMPSRPDEVFSRRYGDCKDKAVLLTAILTEVGFKAHPALVSIENNRAVADWLPSPGVFDHVIVFAVINGHERWIDATRTQQRGTLEQRGQPDFGRALLVGKKSQKLVDIKYPRDYLPSIVIEELFIVDKYDGPVDFIVSSVFSHGEAEWKRRYFANERLSGVEDIYLNFYARIYPGIEIIKPLRVEDDVVNNLLTVIEHYRIPDYWDRKNGRLYSNFYGSTIGDYTGLPKTINRKMPLSQSFPIHVQHSSILQYPEDIDFEDVNDEVIIEDGGMRFIVRSSYKDRRLKVDYIYRALADAVMPSAVKQHLANRRKINENLHFSAWVIDAEEASRQAIYQPPQNIMKKVLSRLASH